MSAKPRLVLIGPVAPLRGGIAQHTTMLHRALSTQCELLTLSFSRQYPDWLYPGDSNREPSMLDHHEAGVEEIIDSVNPLTWAAAVKRTLAHRPERVILPWWTAYWAPCFKYLTTRIRRQGIPVTFLCHNVTEHDSSGWRHQLAKWTLAEGARFIVHSHAEAKDLTALFPQKSIAVHPHPSYSQFPAVIEPWPRRAKLELLFYGFIRPYKGLDVLLQALALLPDSDIMLTIAGECWLDQRVIENSIRTFGLSSRVEQRFHYQSEQDTASLFERADFVVLPYRSGTCSGVLPIAYHYGTPAIVTDVGGIAEAVVAGKTGIVIEPGSPSQLAHALEQAKDFILDEPTLEQLNARHSWSSLAQLLMRRE